MININQEMKMNENIQVEELHLGKNSFIHPTALIRGINGKAKKIVIGDNCYIGESVKIILDEFYLGDYAQIHFQVFICGSKTCYIGHNAWIGQYTVIDTSGGVRIGNNCGIGVGSQLSTHIKYGDVLAGCNFLSEKELLIGDDVWLVGHCIVSPVHIESQAMALTGSVITKNMLANHIYAGVPATSISSKIGYQFKSVSISEKQELMEKYLNQYPGDTDTLKIVTDISQVNFENEYSYFNLADRKYKKTNSVVEIAFMQYLLPEKAKFVPYPSSLILSGT